MRYIFILILFFSCSYLNAQDKIVYRDGKKISCSIISVEENSVSYKDSLTSQIVKVASKKDLIMAEKNGSVFIFGSEVVSVAPASKKSRKENSPSLAKKEKEQTFSNNIIGFQPVDLLLFGRLTMTYERLFNEKQMGIVIPVSLSFDPRILFNPRADSSVTKNNPVRTNVGLITGLDINYYFPTKGYSKFFVGPRFRYGTDVYMLNLTGYSVQLQNGFLLCSSNGKSASTFAVGFGYVRVTSFSGISSRQSFPWASLTIRIGFR
jgi:hypothetical protein